MNWPASQPATSPTISQAINPPGSSDISESPFSALTPGRNIAVSVPSIAKTSGGNARYNFVTRRALQSHWAAGPVGRDGVPVSMLLADWPEVCALPSRGPALDRGVGVGHVV